MLRTLQVSTTCFLCARCSKLDERQVSNSSSNGYTAGVAQNVRLMTVSIAAAAVGVTTVQWY